MLQKEKKPKHIIHLSSDDCPGDLEGGESLTHPRPQRGLVFTEWTELECDLPPQNFMNDMIFMWLSYVITKVYTTTVDSVLGVFQVCCVVFLYS